MVEGSVQVEGTRLRVNAQLIDAATDAEIWSERYDRTLDDAFAIQSDIAQRIVAAVGALMTFLIGAVVWASLNLTMFLGGAIMHEKFDQTLSALPAFFRIFGRLT